MKFAIASGVLRPGDMVPSVRELSKQLVVNPNTVARAYRELQGEAVLEPVRGTGLQVTAAAPEACRAGRRKFVRKRLRQAIGDALRSELDRAEIESILREEWARGNGQAKPSTGASDECGAGGARRLPDPGPRAAGPRHRCRACRAARAAVRTPRRSAGVAAWAWTV